MSMATYQRWKSQYSGVSKDALCSRKVIGYSFREDGAGLSMGSLTLADPIGEATLGGSQDVL